MKLSTRSRYGARAMLDLALHYNDGPVLLRDIAKRQQVSKRYLERLMMTMVSGGFARSTKGKHGGFRLSKTPKNIRLSEIVQALEGSIAPVPCVDDPKLCDMIEVCVTRDIWSKMNKAMLNILDSITLQDMIEMYKKKSVNKKCQMYYI
jgi:Rrf2 family protein